MKLWGLAPPDFPDYLPKEERRNLEYQVRYLNGRSWKIRIWACLVFLGYFTLIFSDNLYVVGGYFSLVLVALAASRSTIRHSIRTVWLKNRLCPECGYGLREIKSDHCPECGSPTPLM